MASQRGDGNLQAIEDRRHEKQLADLAAAAKAANELNSQEYKQAVANENALHALKLKNIADQQKAQNGGGSSSASSGGVSGAFPGRSSGPAFPTQQGQSSPPITIHINNPIGTDAKSLSKFLADGVCSEGHPAELAGQHSDRETVSKKTEQREENSR